MINAGIKTTAQTALILILVLLTGCSQMLVGDDTATSQSMPTPEPDALTIVSPSARPSPMEGGNGAAYMTILNGYADDVQLESVESDVAEAIELHETIDDDGVMRMRPRPEGFTVPAGGSVDLAPGGKHVMMIGLRELLEPGAEIELTLRFDNGDSAVLAVPVTDVGGGMSMPMGDDSDE